MSGYECICILPLPEIILGYQRMYTNIQIYKCYQKDNGLPTHVYKYTNATRIILGYERMYTYAAKMLAQETDVLKQM